MTLTYKSQPQIKSVVGGVATIIARLLVLAYFAKQCVGVIDNNYTLQTSFIKRDLTLD